MPGGTWQMPVVWWGSGQVGIAGWRGQRLGEEGISEQREQALALLLLPAPPTLPVLTVKFSRSIIHVSVVS